MKNSRRMVEGEDTIIVSPAIARGRSLIMLQLTIYHQGTQVC